MDALLGFADQPSGRLVSLAVGLPTELPEDTLDVGRVLLGRPKVLLNGFLESLVCGVLDHLLLAHDEAMLGIIDLAELVEEKFLCVTDQHILDPSVR